MSVSETMMLPPANVFLPDERGLKSWSAVYDDVTIEKLPAGMRSLKVTVGSKLVFDRILSSDQAAHLASLLIG